MELFYSLSILIIIATIFSYLNVRFLKLPSTIGIMLIALIISLLLVIMGKLITDIPLQDFSLLIKQFDFSGLLMGGMLNFLLFAGAIQINLNELKQEKTTIILLSTLSVIISTFIVGLLLYYALNILLPIFKLHEEIPLIYCLLFGALISPTDPVAVLGILKEAGIPKSLEMKVAGESLFNDGLAVVIFAVLLKIANGDSVNITAGYISLLLAEEAIGGLLTGILMGLLGAYASKRANDYKVSVLITLSVVMGGTTLAHFMNISGPLTMVAAGLIIGESGRKNTTTGSNVCVFWELIDNILNAFLFLLIGFELILIPYLERYWLIGIICIIVVLVARYISIKIPTWLFSFHEKIGKKAIEILVWGGLRGGVSIALALSLVDSPFKQIIIAATYIVVLFSILVQGLSLKKVAQKDKP